MRWTVMVRAGALGDFVLSLPLLHALARRPSPVCLVTRQSYLRLLPPGLHLGATVDVDSARAACLFAEEAQASGPFRQRLEGAEVHVFTQRDRAREEHLTSLGVARCVWHDPRPRRPPHAALRFLTTAGLDAPPALLTQPSWDREQKGDRLWIHPGSGGRPKNWPLGFFVRLAAAWQQRHGGTVTMSFGEADLELLGPAGDALRQARVRYETVVCPTLGELKSTLSRSARLYAGNDSGVTHLAAALGVPTIALFRTTDPAVWRPLGRCVVVPHDLLGSWPAAPPDNRP